MIEECWIGTFRAGMDPFANIPSRTDASASVTSSNPLIDDESGKKIPFTDDLLPVLATLAHGQGHSLIKLFEMFSGKIDGRVAKRQFELKLNQIAFKTKTTTVVTEKATGSSNIWTLRPEYMHLLAPQPPSINTTES